ncbi:MAG: permease, partial [Nitrospinota bacterium]|nr:permease [Nitrospinota bacterium]
MLDSSLYLLIGFTLAGILAWIAPRGSVVRFMGGGGILSSLRGALVGAPLPLCSCSVVPATAALREQGASKGAAMAFLISGPETGADSIALTYALMGPYMAVIRPAAALASGILGGVLADSLEPSRQPYAGPADGEKTDEAKEQCDSSAGDHCGDATTGRTFSGAMQYAFDELLMEVAPWLIAGVLFAGIISALLPDDFFER